MGRVPVWPGCRDERFPGASGWESIEHIGPITRTVADAALMMSAIAGPDPRDRLSLPADTDWVRAVEGGVPAGLRVAWWPRWHGQPVDPTVAEVQEAAARKLAGTFGFELIEEMPPQVDLDTAFPNIIALETDLRGLRALVAAKGEPVTEAVSGLLAQELRLEAATDAITTRKAFVNAVARRMSGYDMILSPTVPVVAFGYDQRGPGDIGDLPVGPDSWSPLTSPFNLTGQPAASLPCGLVDGLPVGLQVAGPHLGDVLTLQVSAAFEKALGPLPGPSYRHARSGP